MTADDFKPQPEGVSVEPIRALCALLFLFLIIPSLACGEEGPQPQPVYIGAYLTNVEAVDLKDNHYDLSLVYWMKWRGGIDPTLSVRLVNVIDEWALTHKKVFAAPLTTPDGYSYQRFTVEGKFFHKFWLGTFPLDWQKIIIEFEDSSHSAAELVYVPDVVASGVSPDLALPGWTIEEVYNREEKHVYGSDFGVGSEEGGESYSRYRFGLKIQRPPSFYLLKIVPPIFITLACCLLVFFISASYVDARIGTPIAALLAEVFLQLSFTDELPNVGVMMLLDHVFNFSYFVVFVIMLVGIATTRLVDRAERLSEAIEAATDTGERGALRRRYDETWGRIAGIDAKARWGLPAFFVVGVAVITVWVRGPAFFLS